MKQYYISVNDEQIGPLTFEELKEKKINKNTKVWFEGLDDWKEASEFEELKTIINIVPPPINKISSSPLPPPLEKVSIKQINTDTVETSKILGINKNIFFGIVALLVLFIGITSYNTVEENNRLELLQRNLETESQNKKLEEQNVRLAEQEKKEAERVAKEKKQAIDNRLFEIRDLLILNNQKLEEAKLTLNNATGFKLLRSSSERNEEISLAQRDVDYYEEEIEKLEKEFNKLNPNN